MPKNQDAVAIYSRKSRFTGKGESIGNQVELCRAYIRTVFGDACADGAAVFEDEGFSGGNLNRPDFKRMMRAAREHRFKAVVVYRLDRISRNISDFSALIEELGRLEIDFVSIRESFDTSSPMGRAMMYIASVFSQLERETIAERIRDNMQELAKTGRWLGGTTPTGYTSEAVKTITVDGKSKRVCKLALIPEEADLVRSIYDLYGATGSLAGTEAELLRRRIRTKNGRDFTRFSIKGILQNPVYLVADQAAYRYFVEKQADIFSPPEEFDGVRGILAYNRTDQEKGRATVYRPVSQWIVSVGQHPGLIPAETWIRVQESLERNRSGTCRKPRSNAALLTGLLWCGCGSRMYPKRARGSLADGTPVYTYICKRKASSRHSLCNCPNAGGNRLDAALLEQVGRLTGDDGAFLDRLEKARRFYTGSRADSDRKLEELRQQLTGTERKIAALVDSLTDFRDSAAAGRIEKRIEELHARSAALQSRIGAWKEQSDEAALSDREFECMRQRLARFTDCIHEMTVEQKRTLLRSLVRKVVWNGGTAHGILIGAEPAELPEQENAGALRAPDTGKPEKSGAAADSQPRNGEPAKTLLCEDSK